MSFIIPNLYLGNKRDAENNGQDFDCIISVIDYKFDISHSNQYYINILDNWSQPILHIIYQTADLIDKHIKNNKKVLVHCFGGVSRSASVVISYLMIKHNMSYEKAYMHVKIKRNIICPNPGFKRQLRSICPVTLMHSLQN